jgi:hypothetical protein
MKTVTAFLAIAAILVSVAPAIADGIISQLPPDGSWVQYDVTGEALEPSGNVSVTLKGTFKLSSVGREMLDGNPCRWIEIETAIEFGRGEEKRELTEIVKLLVPEKFLVNGQNPSAHVLKAWKQDGQGVARELNLKGDDAREVTSLDEIFHGPLNLKETKEDVALETPAGNFRCQSIKAKQIPEQRDAPVEFSTQTWLADKTPFGVVAYRYDKMRSRDGVSLGGRWMEWKLAKSGADAKSKIAK